MKNTIGLALAARRRRLLLFAPVILLTLPAGMCQTTRYVTTSCLTPDQYQRLADALPPKVGSQLTGDAQTDLKIIAGSTVELRGYAEGLLQVLRGCTK